MIRGDLKISQTEFGDKLGVTRISIGNYESGKRSLSEDVLSRISTMGYNINWLITGRGTMKADTDIPLNSQSVNFERDIPILDATSAGPSGLYDDHNVPNIERAEEYVHRPQDIRDPMVYALRISSINGDSMLPYFKPNEIVIASPMSTVVNDDKVIAKLNDGRVLFKIINFKNEHIELHSANPIHETISVPATDLIFAHKVIGSWGK